MKYCTNVYKCVKDFQVHDTFYSRASGAIPGCHVPLVCVFFKCGLWHSVHIDDLWIEDINLPDIDDMQNKSVSSLITDAVGGPVPMETSEIDVLG